MKIKRFHIYLSLLFCISTSGHSNCSEEAINQDRLNSPQGLYIDLIKNTLSNTIYEDPSYTSDYNATDRHIGRDHPKKAHTMIGMKRLDNIQYCIENILENNIAGDFIETG